MARRRFRLVLYLDQNVHGLGGFSQAGRNLVNSLDPEIDVVVVGVHSDVVDLVADGRPTATKVIVPPVLGRQDLSSVRAHLTAVKATRPDVLQVGMAHLWSGQYGLLAGLASRVPVVAVVNAVLPSRDFAQRVGTGAILQTSSAVIGVSGFVATAASRMLHLPKKRVFVIYNGVNDPPLPSGRARSDEPLLAAVGRLAREKGFDVLVDALSSVPRCRLVFVGDGPERSHLEARVRDLGLTGRVEFLGQVERPWTSVCSPDLLVLPSRSEGMGLVLVEAMLAGIPVIATRVGGIPEIVLEGETGLLVPPDDASALARAIERLTSDPEKRRRMGERSRSHATGRFTVEGMAKKYEAIYDEVTTHRTMGSKRCRMF